MNKAWIIFAIVGAVMGSAQMPNEKPEEAVGGAWSNDNGSSVKILGVCTIDPSAISCWNLQGRPDQRLSEKMQGELTNAQNYQDPSFRFGKKNRYFVYEVGSINQSTQFSATDGSGLQTYNFYRNGSNASAMMGWGRLTVDPHDTQANILCHIYNIPGPKAVVAPFVEGSKVTYDGTTITMGGWKKGDISQNNMSWGGPIQGARLPKNQGWRLFFGTDSAYRALTLLPLDKDGKTIRYVDPKGRPISDLEYLKNVPQGQNYPNYNQQVSGVYAPAFITPSNSYPAQTPSAVAFNTNVDPKYIGSLQVSATHYKEVLFKGLPLDAQAGGFREP